MIKRHQAGPGMGQAIDAGNTVFISGQVADDARGSILQQTGMCWQRSSAYSPRPARPSPISSVLACSSRT